MVFILNFKGNRVGWTAKGKGVMRKLVFLSGLMISILIFSINCSAYKTSASRYNYRFNETDNLYIKSFQNNDSLFLKNINFTLSADSLIVFEDSIITKKFYKDYFAVYKKISPVDLVIYNYLYTGSIISFLSYSRYVLQLEKVNINKKMRLKYINPYCPRF